MRIIGGELKGRKINPPQGLPVRPTTDIAKEALFNILVNNFDLEEVKVLDLFSGTGSIAYEFASRGVKDITCVEMNYACAEFIRSTASLLKIDGLIVYRTNCFNFLQKPPSAYNIVFADPPYDLAGFENVADLTLKNKLVLPSGWLIIEHPANFSFRHHAEFYELRRYGKVHFSIFRIPETGEQE